MLLAPSLAHPLGPTVAGTSVGRLPGTTIATIIPGHGWVSGPACSLARPFIGRRPVRRRRRYIFLRNLLWSCHRPSPAAVTGGTTVVPLAPITLISSNARRDGSALRRILRIDAIGCPRQAAARDQQIGWPPRGKVSRPVHFATVSPPASNCRAQGRSSPGQAGGLLRVVPQKERHASRPRNCSETLPNSANSGRPFLPRVCP